MCSFITLSYIQKQMNSTTKYIGVLLLLIIICVQQTQAIQFVAQIPGFQRQCFYQVLGYSQKYSIQVLPKNNPRYEIQVQHNLEGQWIVVYNKKSSSGYERTQLHKLAAFSTTHSFCLTNLQDQLLRITVKFLTGVHLMQFQHLPDKTDTENLDRQITWIEQNKRSLYDTIRKIEQHKIKNTDSSALLSTKMIVFAVVGLLSIVGVNIIFFRETKKIFQKRKLI